MLESPWPPLAVLRDHQLAWTETKEYSSYKKTAAVNQFLVSLPGDALLVYPDADEFFEYPCDIEERLNGHNGVLFMQSAWRDRVSADWSLAQVNTYTPLSDQFPRVCRLTEFKPPIQATTKFVLVPARDSRGYDPQHLNSHLIKCAPPPADASEMLPLPTSAQTTKGALTVFGPDSYWTYSTNSLVTCANASTIGPHFAHYRFIQSTPELTERKIQMYHERRKDKGAPMVKMDVADRAQLSLRRYALDMLMFAKHEGNKVYLHEGVRMFCDVNEANLRVAKSTPSSECKMTAWSKRRSRLMFRADGAIDDTDLKFVLGGLLQSWSPDARMCNFLDLVAAIALAAVFLKQRAAIKQWLRRLWIHFHSKGASKGEEMSV